MVVDQQNLHGCLKQSCAPTDSAMQTGLSLPSRSMRHLERELRAALERLVLEQLEAAAHPAAGAAPAPGSAPGSGRS